VRVRVRLRQRERIVEQGSGRHAFPRADGVSLITSRNGVQSASFGGRREAGNPLDGEAGRCRAARENGRLARRGLAGSGNGAATSLLAEGCTFAMGRNVTASSRLQARVRRRLHLHEHCSANRSAERLRHANVLLPRASRADNRTMPTVTRRRIDLWRQGVSPTRLQHRFLLQRGIESVASAPARPLATR